jgi:transcriptional regulator with GAF, ATPase, and Fis domain
MMISCWAHIAPDVPAPAARDLMAALREHGIGTILGPAINMVGPGVCLAVRITSELRDFLRSASEFGDNRIIAISMDRALSGDAAWDLLSCGASDVLFFTTPEGVVEQVKSRFQRWLAIEHLLDDAAAADHIVGTSRAWRNALRGIAEIARFSDTTVLILGESGTGKEIAANLIHRLDTRSGKRDMVILDCSTIVSDLSGSEFFGHERGAFTGALTDRQGAFSLANGGTLFLDEIGELPLLLQAQLLRVIQERTYKRVGGSAWHRTNFRLVCATNRDLSGMVRNGTFRADLYYRIAGFVARLPPLRDRIEDIIPLTEHFARSMSADSKVPKIDPAVCDYLLRRDYPGNVRELQQVVARFMNHCVEDGTISIGYLPRDECLKSELTGEGWLDGHFEQLIRRAVLFGAGLKEIGRAAEDCAIRCATQAEDGSLQRAARRLGVTDRALQIRRANLRIGPVSLET